MPCLIGEYSRISRSGACSQFPVGQHAIWSRRRRKGRRKPDTFGETHTALIHNSRCGPAIPIERGWMRNMHITKFLPLVFILLGMFFQVLSCSNQAQFIGGSEEDIIIFHPPKWGNILDTESYEQIARELGVKTKRVNSV